MHVITKVCVLFVWMHTLTFVKSNDCTLEDFKNSDLYDSNFDITALANTYAPGRQVRVPCNVGYSGFFKLICVEGRWEHRGTKCQPRSCGHPGDAMFADVHLEEGDDFVFGSRVVYICHKGYQMVSRTNYRRCMAQGWDGVVPICEVLQCPAIHVENNVQVFGDPEEATYGDILQFSCKLGNETLSGPTDLYCDENGTWSGEAPKCEGVKCEVPVIENGFVPGDIREYKENEVLHFECNQKYSRPERRPSKCTKVGQKAEFSPTPLCEPNAVTKCKLPTPERGTRFEPADKTVFSPGNKVRVTCEGRSWISNIHTTSEETTCKEDGQWSIRPVCQEVICSNPRDPLVYYWGVSYWQQNRLGDAAQYTCRRGYKKTDGVTQATCTRDGWSPNPLCQEIICERKYYDNADIVANLRAEYKYYERVNYLCKNGYELFTIACGENGWIGTSTCSEACKVPEIPNNLQFTTRLTSNHLLRGQTLTFGCRLPGPFVQGNATIECLENGQWSGPIPTCGVPLGCDRPPYLPDGDTKGTVQNRYMHNDSVEYACQRYYTMEGGPYKTCNNGNWTGEIRCIKPCTVNREAISRYNIQFKYTRDNKLYLSHNDEIEFVCTRGRPVGGVRMRQVCIDGVVDLPTCQ